MSIAAGSILNWFTNEETFRADGNPPAKETIVTTRVWNDNGHIASKAFQHWLACLRTMLTVTKLSFIYELHLAKEYKLYWNSGFKAYTLALDSRQASSWLHFLAFRVKDTILYYKHFSCIIGMVNVYLYSKRTNHDPVVWIESGNCSVF